MTKSNTSLTATLRNRWYVAAQSTEFGARPLGRSLLGEPIVLYRDSAGNAAALEDRCAHRQVPLSLGEVIDDALQCPYHGLCYDSSGACVRVPSQDNIPKGARVRSFPVQERQGFVFVWMGDPALSEKIAPYKFPWEDSPDWRVLHAKFYVRFNYRLLIDNLMDITHLPYVHKANIGIDAVAEDADVKTEHDGEMVRMTRWMENIDQAPAHLEVTGYEGKVDRWQVLTYAPPNYVWIRSGLAIAGTGGQAATGDNLLLSRNAVHIVTPETENSSQYFWATSHPAHSLTPGQEQILYDRSVEAFNEDIVMIERQSDRIDADVPIIHLAADAGALQVRRLMDRLIAAEANGG